MPRSTRPYAPRAGFHITARTQGREKWFADEIRSSIVADIEDAALSFGHQLLAQTVMPNHFHIVVRQGSTPLGWMMQRIMQRAAHFVHKFHSTNEHVFGARYWCCVCSNPGYLRRVIVYTHLNACAAGLCSSPIDYPWSSHRAYMKPSTEEELMHAGYAEGRMLFARESGALGDVITNYKRFIEYVIERRRSGIPGDWLLPDGPHRLMMPMAPSGDAHWAESYSAFAAVDQKHRPAVDIVTKVKQILARTYPDRDIDMLRHAGRLKAWAPIRRNVVATLLSGGYRASAIARCLRVSPALVSRVAASMRIAATQQQ